MSHNQLRNVMDLSGSSMTLQTLEDVMLLLNNGSEVTIRNMAPTSLISLAINLYEFGQRNKQYGVARLVHNANEGR